MNEIVVLGHPSLTSKSVKVEKIDDYIVSLTKKMIQIMYEAPGVGLAAPQIGINKNIFVSKTIKFTDISESALVDKVGDLMEMNNPTIAPYASLGEVRLRITANAENIDDSNRLIKPIEDYLMKS